MPFSGDPDLVRLAETEVADASDAGIVFDLGVAEQWQSDQGRSFLRMAASARHPRFGAPLSEFTLGVGRDPGEARAAAVSSWLGTDFPAFVTAASNESGRCTRLSMTGEGERETLSIVLGPLRLWSKRGAQACCDACLFTALASAAPDILEQHQPTTIKAIVSRDANGPPTADFRINREVSERHVQILREWAATWPRDEFAMRQQFILLLPRGPHLVQAPLAIRE